MQWICKTLAQLRYLNLIHIKIKQIGALGEGLGELQNDLVGYYYVYNLIFHQSGKSFMKDSFKTWSELNIDIIFKKFSSH